MLLAILLATVGAGMILGAQPAVNAALARHLGSPFAATLVSLVGSTLLALPLAFAFGRHVDVGAAIAGPWWLWIGGISGTVFVTAGITVAPLVGFAYFFVAAIAGQLLCGALIDHFGLFGATVRPIDAPRAIGLLLVLAGVAVYRFARA